MVESFFHLPASDQRDALEVASSASGRPVPLLEKDIWVVWTLETLFASPFATQLVFKGGTSLSKAYGVIRRFSEDIDLTYDIRAIAPDLVSGNADALPSTRSQEQKWSKEIRGRLAARVGTDVLQVLKSALSAAGLTADARAEGEKI